MSVSILLSPTCRVASGGITSRGKASPFVAQPHEVGHGGVRPLDQQVERGTRHFLGPLARQQLDAELIQQQQLLHAARVGKGRQRLQLGGSVDRLVA